MLGFAPISSLPLHTTPAATGPYARPSNAAADLTFDGIVYTDPGSTAADLSFSGTTPREVTAIAPGTQFGEPLVAYNRFQDATGFSPTQFGTPRNVRFVDATSIPPSTKFGAPPLMGAVRVIVLGGGADGSTAFSDTGPYYKPVTRNGSIAVSTAQSRIGTGSIALTGASTANNLVLGPSNLFNTYGGAFTLEAQVFLNAYNANGGRLISSGGGVYAWTTAGGIQWYLTVDGAGISFTWAWYGLSGGFWNWYNNTLSVAVSLSAWKHIAVSCDGTTMRLFLEGAVVGSLARVSSSYGASSNAAQYLQIGAIGGEGVGATYAANAHIQGIQLTRDCRYPAAFTPPTTLPDWIGRFPGIAPTTQIPTPRAIVTAFPAGFSTTQFGTGFGQNIQRPVGFLTTNFGAPRIFPYGVVPFNSTQFGNPRLFPFHVGPGIHGTQFGAPSGYQLWSVAWGAPITRFGTPTTPTDRVCVATALHSTGIGWPSSNVHLPPSGDRTGIASGFFGTAFGSPRVIRPQVGIASGAQFGAFGQPSAEYGQQATGFSLTQTGSPRAQLVQRAAGFKPVRYGFGMAVMTQRATGAVFSARFGLPASGCSNAYAVYGINASGRFGQPRGFSRFNHPASGFCSTNMGSPTCHERHRALHIPPRTTFGRALLKRITQC